MYDKTYEWNAILLCFCVDPKWQGSNWQVTKLNKTLQGTSSWDWKLIKHNNLALAKLHWAVRDACIYRIND